MNHQKAIINHLVNKYHPLAILLTGSRAKGYAHSQSDWDIIMLAHKNNAYIGEQFMGQELDMHMKDISSIDNKILANRWSPYQKIKIIYDRSGGRAKKIVNATTQAYKAGPKKLTKEQYETQQSFDRRKLIKMERCQNNPALFLHFLGIFFNEIISHWFLLRKMWPIDIEHALGVIKHKDKISYNYLMILASKSSNKQKIMAAKGLYRHLYL